MINVTSEFRMESIKKRNYFVTADCVLSDGTKLEIKRGDFYNSGNGIVDSSDSSDFPIGVAIEKTATLTLVNDDDRFSGYNFNAARFTLYLTLNLQERSETIKKGTFIVAKKPATAEKIRLTLMDRMSLADREYETKLIFPCTAGELLLDSCQTCGIALGDSEFQNSDYRITQKPENTTHRAVIGAVAALAGGNARIDEDDYLRIITFDKEFVTENVVYDGGNFKNYNLADTLDGGTMNPWTEEEIINGGTFEEQQEYHTLSYIKNLKYDTDDVIVTGVKYLEDDQEYIVGDEGYVVTLDNILLKGNIEDGLRRIGDKVIGIQMRPFSCTGLANAYATFGDPVEIIDVKGRTYRSFITNVDFLFNGSTTFSCSAKSAVEIGKEYFDPSQAVVEQAKKETEKKISAYDIAVQHMNQLAANTLGFYYSQEEKEDGSIVSYRHDKPTLADSKIIYKSGIDGFFLSVDGGNTWKAGFDSNGNAVMNILYAIGLNANWINTGAFTVKDDDGNIIFLADCDNRRVEIHPDIFTMSGKTIEEIVHEKENLLEDAVLFSTDYWTKQGSLATGQEDPDGGTKAVRLSRLKMTNLVREGRLYTNNQNKPIKASGQTYSLSVWMKGSAATSVNMTLAGTTNLVSVTTEWQRYTMTVRVDDAVDGTGQVKFYMTETEDQDGNVLYLYLYDPYVSYGEPETEYSSEEILDMLTEHGAKKAIFMKDGELYVSASAILSGILKLGGANNGNGILSILDAEGKEIGRWDKDGINAQKGKFSGELDAATGTFSGELKAATGSFENGTIGDLSVGADSLSYSELAFGTYNFLLSKKNLVYGPFRVTSNGVEIGSKSGFTDGTGKMHLYEGLGLHNLNNASGTNLVLSGGEVCLASSSSRRYKDHIRSMDPEDVEKLWSIPVVIAKYKNGYLIKGDELEGKEIPMFYAEDMEKFLPEAVFHRDGKVEDWNYRVLIPAMEKQIQILKDRIDNLENRLQEMEGEKNA